MTIFCEQHGCMHDAVWRCRATEPSGNPVDSVLCGEHAADLFAASRALAGRWAQAWRIVPDCVMAA